MDDAPVRRTAVALPAACFVYVPFQPEGWNVGVVIYGEEGVRIRRTRALSAADASAAVAHVNASRGVTAQQARAMLAGSLLGWDHPLARGEEGAVVAPQR